MTSGPLFEAHIFESCNMPLSGIEGEGGVLRSLCSHQMLFMYSRLHIDLTVASDFLFQMGQ